MIVYDDLRKVPLFKPFFEASGVRHQNHFRSRFTMILYRMGMKLKVRKHLPDRVLFKKPKCPPGDDTIIVFDTHTTRRYLRWLCRVCPDKRIILWFWNPAVQFNSFEKTGKRVERWSYSERDAQNRGMRYNTQFFFDCLAEEAAATAACGSSNRQPVALFIGREKGRTEQLKYLKAELEEAGALTDFRLVSPPKGRYFRSLREELIPYREVIEAVKNADILVDYYADPASGLSLRAMEALFFGRKVITNRSLMRGEDFYDSRNIFILGEEKRSIREFLEEPYAPPDPVVRDRYLLSNWLKRFEEEVPDP